MRFFSLLICLPLIWGCPRIKANTDERKVQLVDTLSESMDESSGRDTLTSVIVSGKYDIWAKHDERYRITTDSLCKAGDTLFINKTRLQGEWEVVFDCSVAGEGFDPWYVVERLEIYDSITSLVLVSDGRANGQSAGFLVNYGAEGQCIDALEIFYEDYVEYYSELGSTFYLECQSWEIPQVELFESSVDSEDPDLSEYKVFTRQVVDVLPSGQFSECEISEENIQWIGQTCFLIPTPEIIQFTDEENPEAQDWFTVMDDWAWYSAHTREALNEIGLKEISVEKRYLGFRTADMDDIIIDSRSHDVYVFLFKVGHAPVFVDICMPDIPRIKQYLNLP